MSKKWELHFGPFLPFFELRTIFRPFLGTAVKKAKTLKINPGIYLNLFYFTLKPDKSFRMGTKD